MRTATAFLLVTVASGGSLGAQSPAQPPAAPVAWARVTYLSGGTVYLDAGSRTGLREGTRVDVVRGGQEIARLAVAFISSNRAACTVVSATSEVVVGDSARFTPVAQAAVVATATDSASPVAAAQSRPRSRQHAVRGRLGVRYLMADPGGGAQAWTQPAFDLRLDGHQVGGSPLGVVADVRAYRQRSGSTGRGAAGSTRVYQGHLEWSAPNSPLRVSVGRQLSPALSNMGIFDGVSLEVNGRHWGGGAVGGAQPDALSFGMSGLVREYGAYVQAHNAADSRGVWSVTAGGVGSYDRGQIDREFAYLQTLVSLRRVSLFVTQELDVNRGWKADIEGSSTTPTSTFAMLRVSPIEALSFNVGYDNRRNVRLYRDFVDPVTEFDDAFRQGSWAGVTLSPGSHVRLGVDARQSRGGSGDAARSWTGSLGVVRLTPLGLGAQLRTSTYDGSMASGRLLSGSLEVNPWNLFRLEASGGSRTDEHPAGDLPARALTWRGLDAEFAVARSLFVVLSAYQERGEVGPSRQGYAAISWRF